MAGSGAKVAKPRRTQQERREGTRASLLDATLEGLHELGYGRLTTTEICRRAGVSQGALFKHFATKADLLAAAADHLFERNVQEYRAGLELLADAPDRIGAAIDALWFSFTTPRMSATYEMYVAARSDPELAAHLQPMVAQHRQLLAELARELFPEASDLPFFDEHVRMMLDAMQGAAVELGVAPDDARRQRMLSYLRELSRSFVAGASTAG